MTTATGHERFYNFWVVVRPSEELAGQWTAHCLELDIVTQGNSIGHAFEMLKEAVTMAMNDDFANNLNPRDRQSAPKNYWDELWDNIKHGEPAELAELTKRDSESISFVAAQLVMRVETRVQRSPREVPALWSRRKIADPAAVHA